MSIELRKDQLPPDWSTWGMSAGRGAGKTEAALRWLDSYMHTHPGAQGLIVVPEFGDIPEIISRLLQVNEKIASYPSRRLIEWPSASEKATLRMEDATEAFARVMDLPEKSRVRRYAEAELTEARTEVKRQTASAFVTSSDNSDSIRGIQTHVAVLDNIHLFHEPEGGKMSALDQARIATRLGAAPRIVLTHTPAIDKLAGVSYTMDQRV